jgi:hypothetical protein
MTTTTATHAPVVPRYARFRRRSRHQSDSYDASIQFTEELRQIERGIAADAERFAGYARRASRD